MNVKKECSKCHKVKPFSEFHLRKSSKDGRQPRCKKCNNEISKKYYQEHREQRKDYYENEIRKRMGHLPMCENKKCSSYLGVVIAERLCRHLFKDVEVMPYGNSGYDIVCNRGKKIDVKSSTMTLQQKKYSMAILHQSQHHSRLFHPHSLRQQNRPQPPSHVDDSRK